MERIRPSSALQAANARLHRLRQAQQTKKASGSDVPAEPATCAEAAGTTAEIIAQLPDHLGWGSDRLTAVLRQRQLRLGAAEAADEASTWRPGSTTRLAEQAAPAVEKDPPPLRPFDPEGTVKLYPDIALGMLQRKQATVGRLWLLLRHLDQAGRGWIRIANIRSLLTQENSPYRLCGKRQLRKLLRRGEGLFWQQREGRVWLRSAAKVAAGLGVARLSGRPVALPVTVLLSGVGEVRAHFYASYHSGRRHDNPISRASQEERTGVPARTQRRYGRVAGLQTQANIAVGPTYKKEVLQEAAWQRGRAVFEFIDVQGQQGEPNGRYVAWHLPNSYRGPHQPAAPGRQRKINRQLKDLVNQRAQGNGGTETVERLFYADGAEAGQAYNRGAGRDVYWGERPLGGQRALWSVFLRS